MTDAELHDHLEALGKKIAARRAQMAQSVVLFQPEHHLTGQQLDERYRIIKQEIDREVLDQEARGHHIGDLERSIRTWFAGMDARA